MKRLRMMMSPPRLRRSASGQVVIESIASLIIFTLMIALVMTITIWLYVQQALVTAAREGARQASLNSDLASADTQATGTAFVQNYVQNSVLQLTGQTITAGDVTVTAPTGTVGQRTVTVTVTMLLDNPLGVAEFMNALGGSGEQFDNIPLTASATMRYEE